MLHIFLHPYPKCTTYLIESFNITLHHRQNWNELVKAKIKILTFLRQTLYEKAHVCKKKDVVLVVVCYRVAQKSVQFSLKRKFKALFPIKNTCFCYQSVQKYMAKNIY